MFRRCVGISFATSFVVSLYASAQPANREHISFKSVDGSVGKTIPATVFHPKGGGPFSALVALHGCDGPNDYNKWLAWLQAQGYLVIEPDSLAPRGFTSVCSSGDFSFGAQALDGLGALAYLRSRQDVISTKVGVIGWSHGGAAALISSTPRFIRTNRPDGGAFQAAISFYPACRPFRAQNLASPLLLLLGAADDWEPPSDCIERARALEAEGAPITMKVYQDATHAFDIELRDRVRNFPYGVVHLRYDAAATADSRRLVEAFLLQHLH
jgi:dienelactone hydrolase